MEKKTRFGRGLLVPTGLALALVSLWELAVRFDAMYRPLQMFFSMAQGEGVSLSAAMRYFDWGMLKTPLYLTGCIAAGLLTLAAPGRPRLSLALLAACALLAVYGLGRKVSLFVEFWYLIQPALLILASAGLIAALCACGLRQGGRRPKKQPLPPPRMTDAPRLHALKGAQPGGRKKSA